MAQNWYLGIQEMGIKHLQPGSDSLLLVGICNKSLASQGLLMGSKQMEISGCHIAKHACAWLWCYGWKFTDHPLLSVPLNAINTSLTSNLQHMPK
jgi:hypothetical protein